MDRGLVIGGGCPGWERGGKTILLTFLAIIYNVTKIVKKKEILLVTDKKLPPAMLKGYLKNKVTTSKSPIISRVELLLKRVMCV